MPVNAVAAAVLGASPGFAPWQLSGLVLAPLLNDPAALAALGDAVHAAPYKAPPKAPVLYIKPRNTFAPATQAMPLPAGCAALQVGASVALLIGRTASRVPAAEALAHVAGLALVADIGVPHDSYYRPSVRFKALDASCRVAQPVVFAAQALEAIQLTVEVDGRPAQAASIAGLVRPAAELIAAVSEFMTLRPGDLLLLGVPQGAPQVAAGQPVRLSATGLGSIAFRVVEAAP